MSYRLDYEEEVPKVIERLVEEHKEIDRKLARVVKICIDNENGKLGVALSLLKAVSTEILRHAVEEEAVVARAIMRLKTTKENSIESVSILQEHRRIKDFLEDQLPYLTNEVSDMKARKEVLEFVNEIRAHHRNEEKIVFPLAHRAILLMQENKKK